MSTGHLPTTTHRTTSPSGWLMFAGILIFTIGIFNGIDGLVGLFKDDYYVVVDDDLLVFNYTAWGWIWLILGIVQVITGMGVLAGMIWARALGVGLAILAAIGHLAFLAAYPVWSILVIAMCVLVVYALTVPGPDETA